MESFRWISWGDGGAAGLDIGLGCYNAPLRGDTLMVRIGKVRVPEVRSVKRAIS